MDEIQTLLISKVLFHLLFDRMSLLWMFLRQIIYMTMESVTF